MRYYELTYLTQKGLEESQRKQLLERVTGYIGRAPDKITENPAYTALEFSVSAPQIEELETKIKTESQIAKYLITKKRAPRAPEPARETIFKKAPTTKKEKVELGEIDKKLKEIFGE